MNRMNRWIKSQRDNNLFYNWGWMTLQYGPVMQINQIQLTYPTGAEILKFPNSWIKPQPLSRQLRLVPPQGALSELVIGPGGFLVLLIGGRNGHLPPSSATRMLKAG